MEEITIHERLMKVELVQETQEKIQALHREDINDLKRITMKLDEDMREIRLELGSKIDNATMKALDTVPPWAAKALDSNTKIVLAIVAAFITIVSYLVLHHG